jgi:pimeloyl-ACP methyl ester carboxylesterase
MRFIATDVTAGVITDSGHWVMEEQPAQTTAAIVNFIAGAPLSSSGPGSFWR